MTRCMEVVYPLGLISQETLVRIQPPQPISPGDGIGIRVGLRSQILGVRVSSGAPNNAGIAQLVEHLLAKQDVVSSNLITRSKL